MERNIAECVGVGGEVVFKGLYTDTVQVQQCSLFAWLTCFVASVRVGWALVCGGGRRTLQGPGGGENSDRLGNKYREGGTREGINN